MKKVTFCALKTSLSRNFAIYKHFGDFVKCIFTILLRIQHEITFYLPVNTDKSKFVAFLVVVCATASF